MKISRKEKRHPKPFPKIPPAGRGKTEDKRLIIGNKERGDLAATRQL